MSDNSTRIRIGDKTYYQLGFESLIPDDGQPYAILRGEKASTVKIIKLTGDEQPSLDIYQTITDESLITSSKTIAGAINELCNTCQTKEDESLKTTDKTIVGAINEIYVDKADVEDIPTGVQLLVGQPVTLADSTATTIEELVADYNNLLAILRDRNVLDKSE